MIRAILIDGFKCFEHFELELGLLTLLTGYNGAGKSSSLQPLLLLSQVLRNPPLGHILPLNGSLVTLGSSGDVASATGDGTIRLGVSSLANASASWLFESDRAFGEPALKLSHTYFSFEDGDAPRWRSTAGHALLDAVRDVIFLGAVREPFGEAQRYPDDPSLATGDVGADGQFAPYWFVRQADEEVAETRRHPMDHRVTVRAQVEAWLAELFPSANVNAERIEGLALAKTSFKIGRASAWHRPSNVGYGLSYAFPIIVALVCARPGQVLIIDSPEAHLHPRAQSAMGRILAHFSGAGLQIIVESHSDHLLSGIRLAVRERTLSPDHAVVHFFAGQGERAEDGRSRIGIDADGSIDHWPAGFFDQTMNDLIGLS